MKGFILSVGVAGLLGAMAMAPANAAPIATHGVIVAPAATTDVACRTVKKVVVSRGVRRVTTSRQCSPGAGVYVAPRGYYAPRRAYRRPSTGITVRVR